MVTATGWTLREVDGLTLPEVTELLDYWRDWPPVHVSVRAMLGSKDGESTPAAPGADAPETLDFDGMQALAQMVKRTTTGGGI